MTDTIINLETVNPIEFFGVNNRKLDLLKKKFPLLKILSRGTQIKLSGAPEQIEQAKEKIDLIVQYMERNGDLSELLDPKNPFFGRARVATDPDTKLPFPGNIIPLDRISPNGDVTSRGGRLNGAIAGIPRRQGRCGSTRRRA